MGTYTRADLRTRARQRADMPDANGFVTDTELNAYINDHWARLYELIVACYTDDYTKSATVTIASGATSATLPTDFGQLRSAEVKSTQQPLKPWMMAERRNTYERRYRLTGGNFEVTPESAAPDSYTLWYIPVCTSLDADGTSFSVPDHWEEYIVLGAAADMLAKEETDASFLRKRQQEVADAIAAIQSARDAAHPARIADVQPIESWPYNAWWP